MINTISNRQLFFILLITLTSYTVVTISKEMTEISGSGAWITVLITSVIFGVAAVGIVYLNNLFKGKMLFDYASELVTKPGAYLLSIYYILYFLFIAVFLVMGVSKLLSEDFFPKTPIWAFPLIGMPVFCFISFKGITNVARLAEILGLVFIVTAIFVHILMITEGRVDRILPLFNPQDIGKYVEGFKSSIFPFLGIEVLLVIPFTEKNGKKSIKTAFFTLISIGFFYVLVIESCVMKIGANDIVNHKDALIAAIRDTAPRFLEFLARLDFLYLTVGFAGLFMGISIVMTAITEYLCRIFVRVSRVTIVIAVGAITYVLFLLVNGLSGYEEFVANVGTFLGLISAILIPITLIIIAKIKKVGKKVSNNAA